MICSQCNKEFIKTSYPQKYCSKECRVVRNLEYYQKYSQSEEGRAIYKKYRKKHYEKHKVLWSGGVINCSKCNKEFIQTHFRKKHCSEECAKEAVKESSKKYAASDKGREKLKKYYQSDEYKKSNKKYRDSDVGKEVYKKYIKSLSQKQIKIG